MNWIRWNDPRDVALGRLNGTTYELVYDPQAVYPPVVPSVAQP